MAANVSRLRSPMRKQGIHVERWHRWHEKSRTAVALRAGFKCESCMSNLRPLDWAHLAGRGNIISEPWCSLPELTAALCSGKYAPGCHERVDRNLAPELLRDLRQMALIRLMQSYPCLSYLNFGEPLDGIREAIRHLDDLGYRFDEERCLIVQTDLVRR
jgi:hypothetical protein